MTLLSSRAPRSGPPAIARRGNGLAPGHPHVRNTGVVDAMHPALLLRVGHLAKPLHPTLRVRFTDPADPIDVVGDAVMPVAVGGAGDHRGHRDGRGDDAAAVRGDCDVEIALPEQEMPDLAAPVA